MDMLYVSKEIIALMGCKRKETVCVYEDVIGKLWGIASFLDILDLAKGYLSEGHYNDLYFWLYMLDETGYNDVYRHGRAMFLAMLSDEEYDKGEI